MKKVLIMGGSYFIGKKVVEMLSDLNIYDIYVLNRGSKKNRNQGIHQLIADRNDLVQMKKVLSSILFDYVIDISCLNEEHVNILFDSINTSRLKQVVFLSSSAVYSCDNECDIKLEESKLGTNRFWGQYGVDKINAEKAYQKNAQEKRFRCDILRPPYVYGEYNYARRESFIFDHLFNNRPIIVPMSNNKIQFIYVRDLGNIIISLLGQKKSQLVNIYNVGNKHAITMLEWVMLCGYVAKVTPIIYMYTGDVYEGKKYFPFHNYNNVLNVDLINKICNAETPLVDGLMQSMLWFSAHHKNIVFNKETEGNERDILDMHKSKLIKIQDNVC